MSNATFKLHITQPVKRTYGHAVVKGGNPMRRVYRVELPTGEKITLTAFADQLRIARSTLHKDVFAALSLGVWELPFHRIVARLVKARKLADDAAKHGERVRCSHCDGTGWTRKPQVAAGGETPDQPLPDASPGTGKLPSII